MKIYCSKSELNKSINNVNHAISSRTTSKIMEGILFEVVDNTIHMTGTDTTMTIESFISAEADSNGSFVVPAKLFSSIVSKLPEEDVMLNYDDVKGKLKIKSGNSSSEIICFNSDEFPKIKIGTKGNVITLSKDVVKKIIKKTAFSASNDEMIGIMTGVLIDINNSVFTMVAVDGFRMAIFNDQVETDIDVNTVIPAKLITELSKIISDDGAEMMTMEIVDNKAVFIFDNNKVVLNTMNGKFINYKGLIKTDSTIKIRVKKDDLIKSIDRAALLASIQNNNLIKFSISDELIEISSLSDEGNIDEKVEIIKDGEDINIGFNAKYIMDILKVIEDEEVILNMKNSTSPCIVTPVTGDKYLYLILPIRIA